MGNVVGGYSDGACVQKRGNQTPSFCVDGAMLYANLKVESNTPREMQRKRFCFDRFWIFFTKYDDNHEIVSENLL